MKIITKKIGALTRAIASQAKNSATLSVAGRTESSFKPISENDIAAVRAFFDTDFYLRMNPDVAEKGIDPIRHYLTWGWRERRDPSRNFSTSFYLDAYPDIVEHKLNPLIHYVISGRHEGRRAKSGGALAMEYSPEATIVPAYLTPMSLPPALQVNAYSERVTDPHHLDIHWVVPDFSRGGGGHMTIFRMVHLLEAQGHKCTIWILAPDIHTDENQAYDDIVKHFQCVGATIKFSLDGRIDASGDAIIATGWNTAFAVAAANNFRQKFYFVQDHECEFYPTGSESLLAAESYKENLACICAGIWLKRLMESQYGRWARSFDLAYDHEIYKRDPKAKRPSQSEKKKIAVYAREATSRRCVTLALMALELLGKERQDFEVHFFGQERLPFSRLNYEAWNHGILDGPELCDLYNSSNIGLCFSGTNYSLVPQEMMACGLPIVELDGDSTRSIFPEGVVSLAGPGPESIVRALAELLSSQATRDRQAEDALTWVENLTWEKAAKSVEAALFERMELVQAPNINSRSSKLLDVVIPTYNGLDDIQKVISALRSQTMYPDIQVFCVDSNSTDGTNEWLSTQTDLSITTIPQSEFQHGRTRNLGASLGKSPLVAFLTQDAIPATRYWANDIFQMMQHFPSAAGVYGRHIPYPTHPRMVREEINRHFDNLTKFPLLLSKDTDAEKWGSGDIGWRQLLHYYSDNNSCMRREIWQEIPYPEVDYGEDQVWAKEIIERGYSKLYAPTAVVYHSHDYDAVETYKRSVIEARFFYKYFGYKLAPDVAEELAKKVSAEQIAVSQQAVLLDLDDTELKLRIELIAQKHQGWFDGMKAEKVSRL